MRPGTLVELAEAYGIEVPVTRGFGSFSAFADMYVAACDVLRAPADLRRLVDETVQDAHRAGAVWVEPSLFAPRHRARFGADEAVIELVLDALAESSVRYGVGAGLLVAADRTSAPEDAVEQATLAVRYADLGVVGFGLANDEAQWPPEPFRPAFDIIREAGLLSVPHAGELAGPESVRAALESLGANRIQHGVRAVEDSDLVGRLADERICCDVCPTSNIALGVYPSLAEHPLGALLDAGVPCSVNADDPLLFGPDLLEEYQLCRDQLGFDDERMAQIAGHSIDHSGAPGELVASTRERMGAWLSSLPE